MKNWENMTKSMNKVPMLPTNQEAFIIRYFQSKEMTITEKINVVLPKQANKKNRKLIPSQDFLLKFSNI